MAEEPEKALDQMAEDQRTLHEGLEAELKEDLDKAKGDGNSTKRPWWKVWARVLAS
jgi:hypothetical protein